MKQPLLYLYLMLASVNLVAEYAQETWLIVLTKPLLLTVLAVWFYVRVRPLRSGFERLLLVGLVFSIGGDTLLMLVENGPRAELFFLLGLGSFLVAQLCYAGAFWQYPGARREGLVVRQPAWALPGLLYLAAMLVVLWPGLGMGLRVPVGVYACAIVAMATAALNLGGVAPKMPWRGLLVGVLLFVLSDSLIAWNKFVAPLPYARVGIMLTYLVGQLLIAYAAWRMAKKV
jgi:uncharacterized membrane protein YhhN